MSETKEFIIDEKGLQAFAGQPQEITAESLLAENIQGMPCLVEPFLQSVGLACLAGSSDTGKSTLLRQLAVSVCAGGDEFLGFAIEAKYRSVIYVSTEDDANATRASLQTQGWDKANYKLKGLRFVFEYEDLLPELEKRLKRKPADLIIIDCFADTFTGDLKDTQRIRSFLQPYQAMALKYSCLILFLHHTGKRTENLEPNKNNLLGGQGFEAKMRLVMELRRDLVDPRKRHLCIVKGNYLGNRHKSESIVLNFNETDCTFANTGEHTPFPLLVRQPEVDSSKAMWEEACRLQDEGKTYDQIAEALGYQHRSSIAKLFDKAQKQGWEAEERKDKRKIYNDKHD
jgi:hypothetical protein